MLKFLETVVMCRSYGKSFRRAVLISVVFLGLYLLLSGILSSSGKRLYPGPSVKNLLDHGTSATPLSTQRRTQLSRSGTENSVIENINSSSYSPSSAPSLSSSSTIKHPTLSLNTQSRSRDANNNTSPTSLPRTNSRVLILYDRSSVSTAKEIRVILQSHRVQYDIHLYKPDYKLPVEKAGGTVGRRGRYCIIIFADIVSLYHHWEESHQHYYLDYAERYNVTLINFINSSRLSSNGSIGESKFVEIGNFSITSVEVKWIHGVLLNSRKDFYYLKTEEIVSSLPPNTTWTGVEVGTAKSAFSSVEVLAEVKYKTKDTDGANVTMPVVMVTDGGGGGGEGGLGFTQVMMGSPISFWLTKLMLLEVLRTYVSGNRTLTRFGRERWLMVDIDDIFIAPKGLKLTPGDVQVNIQCSNN